MKINTQVFKSRNHYITSEDTIININVTDCKDLKIKSYSIPHSFYNISSGYNSLIVNDVTYTIIESGLYSISEILDNLVVLIPELISYTINNSKAKVTLTFDIESTVSESYLAYVLGINPYTVGVLVKPADNIYNLNYRFRHGVYITSNNVNNTHHQSNRSIIAQIPLLAPFGSSISSFLSKSDDNNFITMDASHQPLNINVVDSDFKPIDFNGYSWVIEVVCRLRV